jgi:hypothetical protein
MGQFLALMLPAMNVCDRVELLAEIRAHAPAEAFAGVMVLAGQVLSAAEVAELAERVGPVAVGR